MQSGEQDEGEAEYLVVSEHVAFAVPVAGFGLDEERIGCTSGPFMFRDRRVRSIAAGAGSSIEPRSVQNTPDQKLASNCRFAQIEERLRSAGFRPRDLVVCQKSAEQELPQFQSLRASCDQRSWPLHGI